MTTSIFLNYRRDDSSGFTGHLLDELTQRFPGARIFRDIEGIDPGTKFSDIIDTMLRDCDVMLAIIGPHWLDAKDDGGQRRLDNPHDYVRMELARALDRDIRVYPVLVGGAKMPPQGQLPPDLQPLCERQAYELSESRWGFDIDRLAMFLAKTPGLKLRPIHRESSGRRSAIVASGIAVALAGFVGVIAWLEKAPPPAPDPAPSEATPGPPPPAADPAPSEATPGPPPPAVASSPTPEVPVNDNCHIKFKSSVYFLPGRWEIDPHSYLILDHVRDILDAAPGIKIWIEGHTDGSSRDVTDGVHLSQKRADSVKDALVRLGNIDRTRLDAVGRGDVIPRGNQSATQEERAANRRVDFALKECGRSIP